MRIGEVLSEKDDESICTIDGDRNTNRLSMLRNNDADTVAGTNCPLTGVVSWSTLICIVTKYMEDTYNKTSTV